jgi:CDP-paratose synthetase
MKRILITGTTGFVGSHFMNKYRDQYAFLEVSRDNFSTLNFETISKFKPDIFIHLASKSGFHYETSEIKDYINSNITFPSILTDWFVNAGGKKIINIGSYWQHQDNSMYKPNSFYASTKQAFEDILEFYSSHKNINVISLKLFDTYGPKDPRKKILNLVQEAATTNNNLNLSSGKQILYFTHIDDVIDGINHSIYLETEGHQKFFLRTSEYKTLKEIITLFMKVNDLQAQLYWGINPHGARDFFSPLDVLPDLPSWKSKVSLENGLKSIF